MSKEGLRNRLLRTWQLVSSVIRFEDGGFRDQFGYAPSGFFNLYRRRLCQCGAGCEYLEETCMTTDTKAIPFGQRFRTELATFPKSCRPKPFDSSGKKRGVPNVLIPPRHLPTSLIF
jgi:hypothetical protein